MPDNIETVRIKAEVTEDNPLGYIVINEEDFNAKKHERWIAPTEKQNYSQMSNAALVEMLTKREVEVVASIGNDRGKLIELAKASEK